MDRQIVSIDDETLTLQAAEWMLELQRRDVDMDRVMEWQSWMAADPRHKDAFERLQEVDECIGRVGSPPWPTDREVADDRASDLPPPRPLVAGVGSPAPSATALPGATAHASRARRRVWMPAFAASLLAAAVALPTFAPRMGIELPSIASFNTPVIQTNTGELRRVQLSDGSTITLGAFSRMSVDMDEDLRRIILSRGEAFFEVAKDPNRPFIVQVDDTAIRAVGTAFDVRRAESHVSVSVAEGVVEVGRGRQFSGSAVAAIGTNEVTRLIAGQSIQIEPDSVRPPPPIAVDPQAVAVWRNGQRQYLAEPLANVVADLNRYSTRRIEIEDPELRDMAITGSIFERDIERWVKSLEVALPVEVEDEEDRIRIRRR